MASAYVQEVLPLVLNSSAEQPALFDGTTRSFLLLYCTPVTLAHLRNVFGITRNCKGLQEEIKLVPLNLQDRPTWYKEKVYPANKVPALEHHGKVIGESHDLVKYVDTNFEGPSLYPDDPAKRHFGEELLSYVDTFIGALHSSIKSDPIKAAGAQSDYLDNALEKFDDGPFFLGQFSLVDIACIPFVERLHIYLSEVVKYDITAGRPKLAAWIEVQHDLNPFTTL
ncbi:S-crystallin [Trema orientale]|uniref:S-crystallin n=1 Tax=Trema orientale TaxID=63057 RepID=A0A2P5FXG2_TREOI|nr:S-crystallin [Trema orientale]